ncbi:MAG: hypothetical protein OSB62_08815, partial [Alphaproteobacteria bacterium]|nr:hypothetical protein [Alphaproteobacteria bacterium]
MKALRFNILLILLMAPVAYSQATFNVQSSGRGLENAKMGARMQQLHDNQQAVLDVLEPQSFANLPDCDAAGEKINWNAGTSTFTCIQEDDPTVSSFAKDPLPTCAGTEFLQGDGTDMTCVDATAVVTGSEIDPTVEDFAKDPLPTCGANEALKGNGTVLSCVAISGAGVESDPTVYSFAQNPLPTCGVGQVLKANGTVLSCVADTSGGFTESDPLTMTFAKGVMPVCAADEVLSNTDGLGQAFACVDAATAAAGAADDLGSHVATQALDMAGFAIDDVLDPVQAQDAATKNYVDTEVAAGVASVSETDPTVRDFAKDALPNCTASQLLSGDGTDITCVDAATAAAGAADNLGNHVATQALNMSGYSIGDAARIGVGPDFANSGFIVNRLGGIGITGSTIREGSPEFYVNEAGDTYLGANGSGLINMGSNRVQAVADPTSNQDAATKKYVDDQIASGGADDLGDHTATTSLDMASNTIVNVATPVNTEDAANKAYVDSAVASGGADDLGDHTATQTLNMDGNSIFNADYFYAASTNAGHFFASTTNAGYDLLQLVRSGTNGGIRVNTGSSGVMRLNYGAAGTIKFDTNNYDINMYDRVSIGTDSPSSTLHVNGDIQI